MDGTEKKELTLGDITVRVFMKCLFESNYTGVPNWEQLYTKYVDMSGIANEGELGMHVAIHNYEVRLAFITGWLEWQQKVFSLTGQGDLETLTDVVKYGHNVIPDSATFLQQLLKVEAREKKNVSQLGKLKKELLSLQAIKHSQTVDARNAFLTMLNVLGKGQGYAINKDSTDMEELALMIKAHNEQARLQKHD